MLIVRAPTRISFGGGGTDLEAYYARYGGLIINTAINKYVYVIITADTTDDIQIVSSDYRSLFRHEADQEFSWEGELALPKAVLHHFGVHRGIKVFVSSEVPPGTGLGSSSSVAVALVQSMLTLLSLAGSKQEVAEMAAQIEINKMGMPIGKQDQYASSFGGLNRIKFSEHKIVVEPVRISIPVRQLLERRLMLFFTNLSRDSSSILAHQRRATQKKEGEVLKALHNIKHAAADIEACLECGELDEFARLLDYSWTEKRRLASGLTNPFIDSCYGLAREYGALGGKITGAGGGGFMLLYCHEEHQKAVTQVLESQGLKRMSFQFDQQGAVVVLNTLNAGRPWIEHATSLLPQTGQAQETPASDPVYQIQP